VAYHGSTAKIKYLTLLHLALKDKIKKPFGKYHLGGFGFGVSGDVSVAKILPQRSFKGLLQEIIPPEDGFSHPMACFRLSVVWQ